MRLQDVAAMAAIIEMFDLAAVALAAAAAASAALVAVAAALLLNADGDLEPRWSPKRWQKLWKPLIGRERMEMAPVKRMESREEIQARMFEKRLFSLEKW